MRYARGMWSSMVEGGWRWNADDTRLYLDVAFFSLAGVAAPFELYVSQESAVIVGFPGH